MVSIIMKKLYQLLIVAAVLLIGSYLWLSFVKINELTILLNDKELILLEIKGIHVAFTDKKSGFKISNKYSHLGYPLDNDIYIDSLGNWALIGINDTGENTIILHANNENSIHKLVTQNNRITITMYRDFLTKVLRRKNFKTYSKNGSIKFQM